MSSRERERESSLHIRKLTPKECFRLMGFSDESFQQLVNANFSNNTLYHLAGDSIVSTVISFIAAPLTLDEKQAEQRINEFIQMNILEYL